MSSFLRQTLERAIKTAAQTALAVIATVTVAGSYAGIEEVDWSFVASASGLSGITSVLTSVAGRNVGGEEDSPSLVSLEK